MSNVLICIAGLLVSAPHAPFDPLISNFDFIAHGSLRCSVATHNDPERLTRAYQPRFQAQ